jgi:hypothetical protein
MRNGTEPVIGAQKGRSGTLDEFKTPGAEAEIFTNLSEIEQEKFANELVHIRVVPAHSENDLDIITPCVNGVNQPIIRGVPQWIKRKYLAIVATTFFTKTSQDVTDRNDLSSNIVIEKKIPSYPIEVLQDTAMGKAWLANLYHNTFTVNA